jgi:hypothetical protein
MSRFVLVAMAATVLVGSAVGTASAGPDKSTSQIFNAYWDSRHKVDDTHYLRTEWYSGVYSSGSGFFSDLYKSVDLCSHQSGRTRCSEEDYWYGSIDSLGTGSLNIDSKLDTGAFTATYSLRDEFTKKVVGTTTVTVNLTGYGNISSEKYRDTYTNGCTTVKESGTSQWRAAYATGTYTIGTQAPEHFGFTDNAYMRIGSSLEFVKTC